MKNIRLSLFLGVLIVSFFAAGCAAPSRYTPEEIQNYPQAIQEHIKEKEVSLGMTMTQVRYAWGGPDSVRVMEPQDGKKRTQWTYKKFLFSKVRLIFTEGKLTDIISGEPGVSN